MAYEVAEPGNAYLTYKVEDAPNVSYKAYLNAHGKSYTWLRRNRLANEPEYKRWRERQLQDYDTYLKMYDSNYNAAPSQRARLEMSNFSGQYLANGIGAGSSTAAAVNPGLYDNDTEQRGSKGLNKVMQSLELMSAAGIAMKNFGEGKAAMRYASELSGTRVGLTRQQIQTEGNKTVYMSEKADAQALSNTITRLLNASPEENGYHWDKNAHLYVFTGKNSLGEPVPQNLKVQQFMNTLNSENYRNNLYYQQTLLNSLTYENRREYEAATMQAQKEILEGKRDLQLIEKEYAEKIKRMGLTAPLLKAALDGIKLFM